MHHSSLSTTSVMGFRVTKEDKSGAITSGGTAETIMAENKQRRGFSIMNLSDTDMWFSTEGTASAANGSTKLIAGAYYEEPSWGVSTGAVSLFCATTGKAFTAKEW